MECATPHLDEDLHLKRRCPQLDVLLLRNSGANCHPNFADLLKTDDRARFRGSIQHPEVDTPAGKEGHIANMMHVDMLNAYGVWVQKKMYGREFMGIERATYLIGADGKIEQIWRKVKVKGHVEAVLAAARG